jgi:glycosyltransferase involved in cell wall biosynthesis
LPSIVIAIPTFKRPLGLERLLRSLAALETDAKLRVLVADNDADRHEGADLCARIAAAYRWPMDSIIVAERGIAQVRNALVEHALADPEITFVAMLDDDEWVEPQWLSALVAAQCRSHADVVRGSVLREFEAPPPSWALEWEGIAPIDRPTGYDGMIEGIGNVLIARHCFEALANPCFDLQFGLTGGEDKEFFIRLSKLGMQFTRTADAIAYEYVPASRVRLDWSLKRAYRTGNTDMRIALKHGRSPRALLAELSKIAGAVLAFPFLSIAYCFNPVRRLDGVRKLYRAAGKIGALFGHRYREYAVTHGR